MVGRFGGAVAALRAALSQRRLRAIQVAWLGTITAE